jgi:predicted metal-dependent peptidase
MSTAVAEKLEVCPKMSATVRERMTKSRVRFLLTKPFYGTLAARLILTEANYMPTAATDGRRLLYNVEFVNKLSDSELDFLVAHEVLHCVYDHMGARGDRNPQVYNAACDFNINLTLVDNKIGTIIGSDKLDGGEPCYDTKYRDMGSYEIYEKLMEGYDQKSYTIGPDGTITDQDGNVVGNISGMDVHLEPAQGDANGNDANGNPVDGMSPDERKALQDEIKQAVLNAAQSAGDDVPADIKRMIGELTSPKMDWREVLRSQLESSLKRDFTFMRPSKRSGEVIFPGMSKDEELKVTVAIDTSGSISTEMLRDFVSEIQGIMDQYQDYEVTIMQFDTKVYGVETFTAEGGEDISEYEIRGGGGTDFDAVWNYMKANEMEPDQLVMFTDGYPYGSWGDEDYCDTLFVIHGDPAQRIESPFGITIHYDV